jgi:endonuclease/exonuclease/phosphatase family metal-dependent hydrolase
VNSATGPLSVLNMHLAFHDNGERQSQVAYICQLDADRRGQLAQPKLEGTGAYAAGYLPVARIACGDCNFGTDFDQYPYMLAHQWIDAWDLISSQAPRPNTCGIYDKEQWPEGPHTRDFFWLSQELADCGIDYRVDTATALSDHQPLMLEMAI